MERPHFHRVVGMILLVRYSLRGKVIVRRGILLLADPSVLVLQLSCALMVNPSGTPRESHRPVNVIPGR
jgi:hypothetical protein